MRGQPRPGARGDPRDGLADADPAVVTMEVLKRHFGKDLTAVAGRAAPNAVWQRLGLSGVGDGVPERDRAAVPNHASRGIAAQSATGLAPGARSR